mgnify:FL=1
MPRDEFPGTRELETTLRQILDPDRIDQYGSHPQCASAAILVQWATTVLDIRYGLLESDIDVVEEVLERAGVNNTVGAMFKAKGIHKVPNSKGGVHHTHGCPLVCLPELTAARDELWHWKVRTNLRLQLCSGGPTSTAVGAMDCGTIRVNNLRKGIHEAKKGKDSFLMNDKYNDNIGLSRMLKKEISVSNECAVLVQTCEKMYNIRNALRNGDWTNAEKHLTGWGKETLDDLVLQELKQIEMEIEDRHVIDHLELYVLSSGSTGRTISNTTSRNGSTTNSVHGVLLDGLNKALLNIDTNGWVPRSNQAKGLFEAGRSLASIYAAVNARNWTEALSLLNSISNKSARDHWSSLLWDETWQNIR